MTPVHAAARRAVRIGLAGLLAALAPSAVAAQGLGGVAGRECGVSAAAAVADIASRPDGEVLAAGQPIRLAGLAWPGSSAEAARAALEAWMARGSARIVTLPGPPDRWGRPAVLPVRDGILLAADLVAGGLAVVRPDDLPQGCARALMALEREAQVAGRGLWAAPAVQAGDLPALAALDGRFALVEGRIGSTSQGKAFLYLNFGTFETNGFTVTVPKRSLRRFEASGMTGVAVEGRRVRIRGVVVGTDRPRMEATVPEAIERLD
ncbi:MAG: hypothetical protein O9972_29215 [Burkholderiales bacterium]|nr:hypothetical protein [Burkholderiales bacterium]